MPEAEALQLLTGRPDPEALPAAELAEAKALAADLGHLPLALAQAAAYIRETAESFAGYRELLRTSRPAMLAEGRPTRTTRTGRPHLGHLDACRRGGVPRGPPAARAAGVLRPGRPAALATRRR